MKGDSAGIEIEINGVLNESLEGKANPVHSITPRKGDVCYDDDKDGSPVAISSNKVLWLQPKTRKLAVTASVFVIFLFICIGIGIRSSNKNEPAATVYALALQGSDGISPRVIGGTPLDQGVWREFRRYLVSIRWNDKNYCGGTLISSRVVLTAANCFDTLDGTNNFLPSDEIAFNRYDQRLDAGVRTIVLCQTEFGIGCDTDDLAYAWRHPDWNINTFENDVALIFLPAAQRIAPNFIRPVKLNRNPNVPADGQDVEAFGWGTTCDAPFPPEPIVDPATAAPTPTPECIDSIDPNEIQTGNLRYLTNQVCNNLFGGDVTPDMMCARTDSNSGVAVGFGDSGGPLVIAQESGETLQVGVVSFGSSGPGTITKPDLPDGFARVSFFFDWISSTVCQEVPRDKVFCRGPRAKASKPAKAGN